MRAARRQRCGGVGALCKAKPEERGGGGRGVGTVSSDVRRATVLGQRDGSVTASSGARAASSGVGEALRWRGGVV